MYLPHLFILCVVVMGVAYLMVRAGTGKSALESRRIRRTCPSCGRVTRDCCCR
jgi:hypothetical protein